MKKLKLFLSIGLSAFFLSCAGSQTKPTQTAGMIESADEQCFQYIIKNKTKEFISHLDQCKKAHNPTGLTALSMVIAKENMDLVEALIEAKVDVNEVDPTGATALVFAANKNNARAVQLLRRAGARVEIVNNNLSGLMMAVRNSSLELIEVMNPTVEEMNLQAEDGWSALYFAISRGDIDILKYLLNHGACTQQRDSDQERPIDFAREKKWKEAVQLLSQKRKC